MQNRVRRRVVERQSVQDDDSNTRCYLCLSSLNIGRTDRHPGKVIGSCDCDIHAECLVNSMQNGRSQCEQCEQELSVNDSVRVRVPRQINDNAMSSPIEEDNFLSYGDECGICTHSLSTNSEPVGHPDCCEHEFHLRCLIETAFIPARPHASQQSIDPDFPHCTCPLCRREFVMIRTPGAPHIYIHYESLEERYTSLGFDSPIFRNVSRRRQNEEQQQQQSWGEWLSTGAAVILAGAVVIVGIVLLRH